MHVVWAVAAEADVDPCTLPPLVDVVDPDALDSLIDGCRDHVYPEQSSPIVTFSYAGHRVTVEPEEMLVEGLE
jgi:hypothetical protein